MKDMFEFTLNNPLTDEQWDMITDVDFDRTDRVWFHTKHGKEVEFAKVIRCKDCKYYGYEELGHWCVYDQYVETGEEFCSRAEREEE